MRLLLAGTVNPGGCPTVDFGRDSQAGQQPVSAVSANWWSRPGAVIGTLHSQRRLKLTAGGQCPAVECCWLAKSEVLGRRDTTDTQAVTLVALLRRTAVLPWQR